MMSPTKTLNAKRSKFKNIQTRRHAAIATSFEGLNNSLAQSPGKLWSY